MGEAVRFRAYLANHCEKDPGDDVVVDIPGTDGSSESESDSISRTSRVPSISVRVLTAGAFSVTVSAAERRVEDASDASGSSLMCGRGGGGTGGELG
jgi:hypothetical protein